MLDLFDDKVKHSVTKDEIKQALKGLLRSTHEESKEIIEQMEE